MEGYLQPLVVHPTHALAATAADAKQFGKLWKPKERSILSWSIMPREKSVFFYMFQQSGTEAAFLPICLDACISSVSYEDAHLLITLQAINVDGYVFTIVFPENEIRYSHDVIRDHLTGKADPNLLDHIVSNLLNLTSPKNFVRSYQGYTSNIGSVLSDHEIRKAKGKGPARRGGTLALQAGSISGTGRSGLASREATPATQTRKRANPDPSASGSKKSKSTLAASAMTFMNPTMKHATCEKDIDYESASKTLKDFWEKCADCYVLGREQPPVEVSINLLDPAEAIVRSLETTGIAHYKNILTNAMGNARA